MRFVTSLVTRRYYFEMESRRLYVTHEGGSHRPSRLRRYMEDLVEGSGGAVLGAAMFSLSAPESPFLFVASIGPLVVLATFYAFMEAPSRSVCTGRRCTTPVRRQLQQTFSSLLTGWCALLLYSVCVPLLHLHLVVSLSFAVGLFVTVLSVIVSIRFLVGRWLLRVLSRMDHITAVIPS